MFGIRRGAIFNLTCINSLLILVVDWCTWHLIRTLSHKWTWWIIATVIPNDQKTKSCQFALVFKNLFVPKAVKFFWVIPEIFLNKNMLWWPDIFGHQNQKGKTCSPRLKDVFEAFVKKWKSLIWHARRNVHSCIHLVKNLERAFGKGSQNLGGDWINLLSITLKQTNYISCLFVKLYHYSSCFLLVSHTSQPRHWLPLFN